MALLFFSPHSLFEQASRVAPRRPSTPLGLMGSSLADSVVQNQPGLLPRAGVVMQGRLHRRPRQ